MNHPVIEARMKAIQSVVMATYHAGVGLPANVAGREREIFIRSYLRELFPSTMRFSSGVITDFLGKTTGQLDIVVERPFAPSFPMPLGEERVFLADNVGAVIEVKSNVSKQWSEVASTTEKVSALAHQEVHTGFVAGPSVNKIPVLAVGYLGFTTVEGVRERLKTTEEEKRPAGLLCLESGCFAFDLAGKQGIGKGPMGLFMFVCALNHALVRVITNDPDIWKYRKVDDGND